jgi:hypothetical protein
MTDSHLGYHALMALDGFPSLQLRARLINLPAAITFTAEGGPPLDYSKAFANCQFPEPRTYCDDQFVCHV